MVQVVSFALPATSCYHACEHITRESRADSCTHCLHARIIGVAGINTYAEHVCWRRRDGASWVGTCADGTIKINPISLCSHTDAHPNLNREVRHSLTWHSSESESALERFEPVAAAMLWSDGRGTLFAPVAARRQGRDFKERGIDQCTQCVGWRRRDRGKRCQPQADG